MFYTSIDIKKNYLLNLYTREAIHYDLECEMNGNHLEKTRNEILNKILRKKFSRGTVDILTPYLTPHNYYAHVMIAIAAFVSILIATFDLVKLEQSWVRDYKIISKLGLSVIVELTLHILLASNIFANNFNTEDLCDQKIKFQDLQKDNCFDEYVTSDNVGKEECRLVNMIDAILITVASFTSSYLLWVVCSL
jgi:hypothetical protein